MPPDRSDTRLLLMATAAVLVAGVLVAVVLLFATSEGGPKNYQPFQAGLASSVRSDLRDGGPYYFPDPFGGQRSILFALERGSIVALSTLLPDTKDCHIKWKGQIDRFVDCHGDQHRSGELDRYEDFIDPAGENKGILFVDLRKKLPAPEPASSAN
ncbi:MAG: hypothetical protein WD271_13975 [Acidimicrobiia bacterium]